MISRRSYYLLLGSATRFRDVNRMTFITVGSIAGIYMIFVRRS